MLSYKAKKETLYLEVKSGKKKKLKKKKRKGYALKDLKSIFR